MREACLLSHKNIKSYEQDTAMKFEMSEAKIYSISLKNLLFRLWNILSTRDKVT